MSSQLQITGNFPVSGASPLPIQQFIDIVTAIGGVTPIALASGYNAFTIPAGTTIVMVVLPPGNSTGVTAKGPTGDTGIPLQPAGGVWLFMPASSVTTFGLTAAGVIASITRVYYI